MKYWPRFVPKPPEGLVNANAPVSSTILAELEKKIERNSSETSGRWIGMTPTATSMPRSRSLPPLRSEEHTSELQSQSNLVCRLLLEKKKQSKHNYHTERSMNVDI